MTNEEMLLLCKDGLDILSLNQEDSDHLLQLAKKNLCGIPGNVLAETKYYLLPDGEEFLRLLDENRQKKADDDRKHNENIAKADENRKKQFRHDWWITIAASIISFISGLIVEYFSDIVGFLIRHK